MEHVFTFAINSYQLKKYNQMCEPILEKYQLTQVEVDVIAFLSNYPEYQNAQDIVSVRGISRAHVSTAVSKLVKRGLLERVEDAENRRKNKLHVTEAAQPLVRDINRVQEEYKKIAYNGFSREERDVYNDFLRRIYHNLGGDLK